MEDCGLEMAISANQNKETCSNGANLRPDSTAVNSWATKKFLKKND
jgi:hypothetical protein